MSTLAITQELDAIQRAFEEFKTTNDQRLEALSQNRSPDPLIEEKMQRLDKALDQMQDTLRTMQVSQGAPGLDASSGVQRKSANKGLADYILYGREDGVTGSIERKGLGLDNPEEIGLFLPEHVVDLTREQLEIQCPVRQLADVVVTQNSKYELLTTFGKDFEAKWVEPGGERIQTKTPAVTKRTFDVHMQISAPLIAQKLMADAQKNVEDWISKEVSRALMKAQNQAFLWGEGKVCPSGILAGIAKLEESQPASENTIKALVGQKLDPDLLITMAHDLATQYRSGAKWLMSRDVMSAIRRMTRTKGAQDYLLNFTRSGTEILGHEVVLSDDFQEGGGIVFGDFKSGYLIVDRMQAPLFRDPYTAYPHVFIMVAMSVGGGLKDPQALMAAVKLK